MHASKVFELNTYVNYEQQPKKTMVNSISHLVHSKVYTCTLISRIVLNFQYKR